jgi:hypothetical protein
LVEREAHGAMAVGRVLEHGERRPDLGERHPLHALGRRGVDRDADGAEPVIEEDLREHATGRVPDEDRRCVQAADDRLEVFDERRHRQLLDRRRVGVERLDLDLEPGIRRSEHAEAALLVVRDPVLPTAGRDPEAVDQDDGVGCAHRGTSRCGRRSVTLPESRARRAVNM